MDIKPGDVVILKSGGQPLTVAEVNGDSVACLWLSEEGDLFRETLPRAVLDVVEIDTSDEGEDEDDNEHEHEDDEDDDEDDSEDDAETLLRLFSTFIDDCRRRPPACVGDCCW